MRENLLLRDAAISGVGSSGRTVFRVTARTLRTDVRGQKPRPLQENATRISRLHPPHRKRAKPRAIVPQVRNSRRSLSTNNGNPCPSGRRRIPRTCVGPVPESHKSSSRVPVLDPSPQIASAPIKAYFRHYRGVRIRSEVERGKPLEARHRLRRRAEVVGRLELAGDSRQNRRRTAKRLDRPDRGETLVGRCHIPWRSYSDHLGSALAR